MTWSVYQHWDPLQVCAVGRSYPPEFYSWITVPHVRELFERIAVETEEDYQGIIAKLTEFGVEVLRPDLPATALAGLTAVQGKGLSATQLRAFNPEQKAAIPDSVKNALSAAQKAALDAG